MFLQSIINREMIFVSKAKLTDLVSLVYGETQPIKQRRLEVKPPIIVRVYFCTHLQAYSPVLFM